MAKTVNWIFACALPGLIIADLVWSVPGWTYAVLCLVFAAIQVYGSAVLSSAYYIKVLWRGEESSRAVALTFDDGPVAGRTDKILEILERDHTPAAFFCIGKRVDAHPQLVQRMYDAGHLIANHSYLHGATFDLQSSSAIGRELESTAVAIEKAIGLRPSFFRPPYGVTNPMVAAAVRKGKYKTIGWSIRSFDTVIKDRARLLLRITRSLKGGDIILLHDHGPCTADVLPDLIRHISSLGLKIVRVDQLLNENAYERV